MLFKRRDNQTRWQRLRGYIWPESGWLRFSKYMWYRLARLDASPHSLAAGIAAGVAVSFTPFLGFHIILASLFCLLARGHILAAALATFVGNPWTFPAMLSLTGLVGSLIMGERVEAAMPEWSWNTFLADPRAYIELFYSVFEPFVLGALPTATCIWLLVYFPVIRMLTRYKDKRKSKLQAVADGAETRLSEDGTRQ